MTAVKAQAVSSAIIGAGFDCTVHKLDPAIDNWTVRATSALLNINVTDAAGLAVSQSIVGSIALIEYS